MNVEAFEPEESQRAEASQGITLADLHPLLREAVQECWERGDYAGALRRGWFAVRDQLRDRLGRPDLDGENLVNAIGETADQPALPLTDYSTATEKNVHRGIVQLLRGILFYGRHPEAHESDTPVTADRVSAFECLVVMDICLRFIAEAASPTVIDDVIADLVEPHFPTTNRAIDDAVRAIPRRRLPEFLDKVFELAVEAFDANKRKLNDKLHATHFRALLLAQWDEDLVAAAAARCSRLIARDETLNVGSRMLHGPVFKKLEMRYQEKVVAAMKRVAETGRLDDGGRLGPTHQLPLFDLMTRIEAAPKGQIVNSLIDGIAEPDLERHGFAGLAATRSRSALSEEERIRVANAIVRAMAETPSSFLARLVRAIGEYPENEPLRGQLLGALRDLQGQDLPGRELVDSSLTAMTEPDSSSALETT